MAAETTFETIETQVPARLDRRPWSRFHWRVVLGLGIVWVLDGLEVMIIGFLAPTLVEPGSGSATSCRLCGHRERFWAEGSTMRWACERECGMHGSKEYEDPRSAQRYAAAFDREDNEDLGRRAPPSIAVVSALRRRFRSQSALSGPRCNPQRGRGVQAWAVAWQDVARRRR